jgi:predicted dehydrogenase
MKKINTGIIGMGLIGTLHADALKRIGSVDLVAITDANYQLAKEKSEKLGVEKCYSTADELIADPEIEAIHNCTPNHLHLSINEKIILAGKHILSEKPLGISVDESSHLLELLKEYPDIIAGVNFNYRMNPLVQDMKHRVEKGEIGKPYLVHGSYLQDWLLYDTDYNWRVEPEYGGASRAVADIGSHWMDTAQTIAGLKITEVFADITTIIPIRKKPVTEVETFSISKNLKYEAKKMLTEDYAAILVKFENDVSGIFYCSQVSAGRKCFLNVEIDGSKSSLYWNQETADWMWKGNRDTNNELVMRNPNFMSPESRRYTSLPAGHPEGWHDALKNNFEAFYFFIQSGKKRGKDKGDFATFEDGHYIMRITEAIMRSSNEKRWVKVEEI